MAIWYLTVMCFVWVFLNVHARPSSTVEDSTFSSDDLDQSVTSNHSLSYNNDTSSGGEFQYVDKDYQEITEAGGEYVYEDDVYYAHDDVKDGHVTDGYHVNMLIPLHDSGNITIHLREPPKDAPPYMLELYDRTARKHRSHRQSNIVRSFMNINQDVNVSFMGTANLSLGSKTRVHSLVFNLTAVSRDEDINLAQIRLYKLVAHDRNTYIGEDRKVGLYEIIRDDTVKSSTHARMIASRRVYGRHSGWEAFDVTTTVRRWLSNRDSLQILEVRIESVFQSVSDGDVDIDTSFLNKNEPLLVVFSSEFRLRRLYKDEIREITQHEKENRQLNTKHIINNALFGGNGHVAEQRRHAVKTARTHNKVNITSHGNSSTEHVRRKRAGGRFRKTRRNNCRRRQMFVYFQDIQWDFVIAPSGYHAFECTGKCYYPILPRFNPTKHAKIQASMNFLYTRKVSRPCCVPTKLDPMSLLYMEKGAITMKYAYEGMIVDRCGCR